MRSSRMVYIGVIAALALGPGTFACNGESEQEIIDSFIGQQPPVDLTDRMEVERAAFHSQHDWMILQALTGLLYVGTLAEEEGDCPQVIDHSDPETGNTDIEYRGDGCVYEDNGESVTIDGRVSVTEDQMSMRIEYHDLVLTFREEESPCPDAPHTARLSLMGSLSMPAQVDRGETASPGEYDVLLKYDISTYTDECRPVRLTLAHDHEIEIQIVEDQGQEQTIINQHGRSAADNHGSAETASMYQAPSGSFSVDTEDLVLEPYVCSEPTGGRITLSAGENTVVIEPNGAIDCDEDHCAPWTLNGEAQPEPVCGLQGLGCRVSTRAHSGLGVLILLGLSSVFLLLTAWPRRQRVVARQ